MLWRNSVTGANIILKMVGQSQTAAGGIARVSLVREVAGQTERVLLLKRQLTDAYLSELCGLLALRFVRRQANALPLLRRRLRVIDPREEPDAGIPLVRICAGSAGHPASPPRLLS